MSSVTVSLIPPPAPPPPSMVELIVTMTRQDAGDLIELFCHVGGDPCCSARALIDDIRDALIREDIHQNANALTESTKTQTLHFRSR